MHEEDFQNIIEALENNSTPRSYTFDGIHFTKAQFQQFCAALANNLSLFTLNFSNLQLDQTDITTLAAALKENEFLVSLFLYGIPLDEHKLHPLTSMLAHNQTITNLLLISCQLDDSCMHLFAKALESNNTLVTLDLNLNPITSACDESLARSLLLNTCLTTIKLDAVFEKTHRQLQFNTELHAFMKNDSFPNIAMRNAVTQKLKQKFAASQSLLGDVLQKKTHVAAPSLRDIAHHQINQTERHGMCDLDNLRHVIPEELLIPLQKAQLHRKTNSCITKLSLFNPISQALQRQQRGEAISAEETFTFKVMQK